LSIQDVLNRQRPLDVGAPLPKVAARGKLTRLREDEFETAATGAFQAVPRIIPELADDDVEDESDMERTIERVDSRGPTAVERPEPKESRPGDDET
jgi:hypothetical protein